MAHVNSAQRAYLRRFTPAMMLYVVALTGAFWVNNTYALEGVALYAVAALPALPLLAVIAAMMVYLRDEQDEYRRDRTVRAMVLGTSILLAVLTVWGFLEMGADVPHFPTFLAFPIWCGAFGVAYYIGEYRDRLRSSES